MIQSLLSGHSGRTRVRVSVVRDWLAHDTERSIALLIQRDRCPATTNGIGSVGRAGVGDKGYLGEDDIRTPYRGRKTPYRGRNKPALQKDANRAHARLRAPGERANVQLKSRRIVRKLRRSRFASHVPHRESRSQPGSVRPSQSARIRGDPRRVHRPQPPHRPAGHPARVGRPARRDSRPRPRRPRPGPRSGPRLGCQPQDHLVSHRHRRPRPRHWSRSARPEPRKHPQRRADQRETGPPGGHDPPGPGFAFTPADADGPPGGYGSWRFTTGIRGQPALLIAIDPIATGTCDHRFAAAGHDPGVELRHLSQVRHAFCAGPMCRRPSIRADFEHNTPYDQGGRSCLCNGGPKCRHEHRLKQDPRWTVEQPPRARSGGRPPPAGSTPQTQPATRYESKVARALAVLQQARGQAAQRPQPGSERGVDLPLASAGRIE